MVKANIGLQDKETDICIWILEKVLATEVVMEMKVRNYHWNIKGSQFNDLHSFFEEMYGTSAETIDEVAERIRMLGQEVEGNYARFLKDSLVPEETKTWLSRQDMIQTLFEDKEKIISQMRKDILEIEDQTNDMGTADFLTAVIQTHEKNAWMLRSMVS